MPLSEPLPEQIQNALTRAENETADPLIAFPTDIASDGRFGEEWLVLTGKNLYVFSPNGGPVADVQHAVPLQQITDARTEMLVGNGVLEVYSAGQVVPILRFSLAEIGRANTAARRIAALAKGEEAEAAQEAEDKKVCKRCGRLIPEDSDICEACVNKRAVLLRLFRFLAPYKVQAACSVMVILCVSALELIPPYLGGRIVDTLTTGRSTADQSMGVIVGLVAIMAVSRVCYALLQYAQRRLNAFLGARILMDIRLALFERFNMLSLGYYDKRSTGSVMARITNDSDNLWDFLMDGIPWFISNALVLVGTGIVLFRMNWRLALMLLGPAPFIYAMTQWFLPLARARFRRVWHRISRMYSTLNSTLNGMRVIKAFAQEDRENEHFRRRNLQVFQASFEANAMWAVYMPVIGLLMAAGYYIIWLAGGHQVLHGTMTVGTLTAFSGYLLQFYAPFQNFSRVLDWSTRSLTAAERVFEVLDTEPDVKEAPDAVSMPVMKGEVEFRNVSFSYDKSKRVLENFSLHVQPGEMIGLVGHSGAGKSTLINLLSRFYDVTEGQILIDGVDVRKIKQEDFRRQFGIVLQEPFLFPGTIRDNIAYGKPDATPLEIMCAAKAANCHEFIMKFPDGYDSQVGERGQRLSGGERQRISIARAILHDPKILILDEATASVDTETEKQIQEAIARLIENRTTFAIAHRLSTLRNADRLVVMKDGKMAEIGTHDELIEQDGVYAGLVKVQTELNRIRAA
jgi:ATP-binding cassette, subfamily B, bacterial